MIRTPQDQIEEMEKEAAANYANAPARTGKKIAAHPAVTNRNLNNSISEKPITDLTALKLELETQNQELETRNQELETETKNLKGPIQNISRAQWSIDEYCPKVKNVSERRCRACQEGWRLIGSSCNLFNDPSDQKTCEEAREDCRARSSDLLVLHDEDEPDAVSFYSWYRDRSWIGLRAEGGRWKWIDGSNLTESFSRWRTEPPPPTDGQCVVYYQFSWKSVSCAAKRPWICKKNSLSV